MPGGLDLLLLLPDLDGLLVDLLLEQVQGLLLLGGLNIGGLGGHGVEHGGHGLAVHHGGGEVGGGSGNLGLDF